tara:strand:+ start:38 stop:271 length:234 start_codon:yes stop_codon:yes gene_type:complete
MVNNKERIEEQTQIRKLQEEREYNEKVAALFEDDIEEQIERKKTDDALFLAARNAILITGVLIFWDIITNGFRWTIN